MNTVKRITLTLVIGLVLIAQLLNPAAVYADGKTPPAPTETSQATEPPVSTELPTEDIATKAPVATETPSVEPVITEIPVQATETPVATLDAVSATPETVETAVAEETEDAQEPTVLEVIQEIPSETNIVVVDESGQTLPLATEDAADIIATSDPIWCPTGQVPTPGANGCTSSYGSLGDLLANESTYIDSQKVNGTIWITTGIVGDTSQVVIDGCGVYDPSGVCIANTNWSKQALTLQGGWSGTSGDTSISSNSVFFVPIGIYNWNNDLTVNNITVQNADAAGWYALALQQSTAATANINDTVVNGNNGSGLNISNTGNVNIRNSSFSNNSENGADIDGARINIRDSRFDNNGGYYGLHIISNDDVSIDGSTFTGHSDHGADISANNITIANSRFEQNFIGAELYPELNITVDNNFLSRNGWDGLEIFTDSEDAGFANTIDLNGNVFYFNNRLAADGYGVWLVTDTYDNVFVNGNTFLNNDSGLVAYTYNVFFGSNIFNLNCTDIWTYSFFQPGNYCGKPLDPDNPLPAPSPITLMHGSARLVLNCAVQNPPPVSLPNGDLIEIHCPVSGVAEINRRDSTTLPAPLPDGYTYASAFEVRIINRDRDLSVIDRNGYIKASFLASHLQLENSDYSVLYWDAWKIENGKWVPNPEQGRWVPLKDFMRYGNGPRSFYIDDDLPGIVRRKIISGVQLVSWNRDQRVEVSVNFPGIFVLAQH